MDDGEGVRKACHDMESATKKATVVVLQDAHSVYQTMLEKLRSVIDPNIT